ncbi:hypothetical protein ACWDLG_01485 [Nonomuraea sp. NPDC003727]
MVLPSPAGIHRCLQKISMARAHEPARHLSMVAGGVGGNARGHQVAAPDWRRFALSGSSIKTTAPRDNREGRDVCLPALVRTSEPALWIVLTEADALLGDRREKHPP